MKRLLLLLTAVLVYTSSFGQSMSKQEYRNSQSDWIASIGINALGNLGTRNPAEDLGDFSLKNPLIIGIEYRWLEFLSVEQDIVLNGFNDGEFIDNGTLSEDIFYFSTNTNLKFYFSDYIYDADWVDLYIATGLGIFTMEELNTSVNVLGGVNFWVNETRTIGIRLQSAGKLAFNSDFRQYANNHWIHSIQATFRL